MRACARVQVVASEAVSDLHLRRYIYMCLGTPTYMYVYVYINIYICLFCVQVVANEAVSDLDYLKARMKRWDEDDDGGDGDDCMADGWLPPPPPVPAAASAKAEAPGKAAKKQTAKPQVGLLFGAQEDGAATPHLVGVSGCPRDMAY